MEITQADTPTVWMDCHSRWLGSYPVAWFSSIIRAVNFISTIINIHSCGIELEKNPLFIWAIFNNNSSFDLSQYGKTSRHSSGDVSSLMHRSWCRCPDLTVTRMTWQSLPTLSAVYGICSCRRLDEHQMTLVLAVLSWSQLDLIHSATSSIHADIYCCSCAVPVIWQAPLICMLSAYRCGHRWFNLTSSSRSAL